MVKHLIGTLTHHCCWQAFDVVVIGGGVVGLATAYWLTSLRPDLTVALLEKHTVANAAARWRLYFCHADSLAAEAGPRMHMHVHTQIQFLSDTVRRSCNRTWRGRTCSWAIQLAGPLK